jgi:hypothetical protein
MAGDKHWSGCRNDDWLFKLDSSVAWRQANATTWMVDVGSCLDIADRDEV